jgi:methylphosphotriester-DNA--protein-cysteine methyltransferase
MYEWNRQVQKIVDEIDRCIENRDDNGLALTVIARENGYSEFHMTRKFKEMAISTFRRSRTRYQMRTATRYAGFWTALKASWMAKTA